MSTRPLADEIRPRSLDEVVGQRHLIGPGGVLRRLIDAGTSANMIFYGPSGTGKTTIANIIANKTNKTLYRFNATTASLQDVKDIIASVGTLMAPGGILLYLDEIQYFNKKQQQSLLEFMENGSITLIASTTENPFFSVTPAIRSRVQIFELEPLSNEDIKEAILNVLGDKERGFAFEVHLDDDALDFIATATNGDLRSAYNSLDLAVMSTPASGNGQHHITLDIVENSLQRSYITMDKDGDGHYDVLSALQKSIRGSDVNASLHYAARLVEAGDLPSLARRLTVIAYEDIGLANPDAQVHTVTALEAAQKIGFPEARILIANVVIDLALSPKSNSAYKAMDAALADLRKSGNLPIPRHLRDGHYAGSKALGNAQDYKYPHAYPEKWVKQQYLPDKLRGVNYFQPNETGKYERALGANKERIDKLSR